MFGIGGDGNANNELIHAESRCSGPPSNNQRIQLEGYVFDESYALSTPYVHRLITR